MRDLHIRPARPTDLAALTGELGQGPYFADRLSRQQRGDGLLLTAWRAHRPIGVVYLWLEDAEEPEIRDLLPDTPLLTHLEIHQDHRNQGIGTRLVRAAEQELAALGHTLVALGVEMTNVGAAMLYLRLGFREWPHSPIACFAHADDNGFRRIEICRIMTKSLSQEL